MFPKKKFSVSRKTGKSHKENLNLFQTKMEIILLVEENLTFICHLFKKLERYNFSLLDKCI